MKNLFKKICALVGRTWEKFRSDSYFSVYYALLRVVDELGGRVGLRKLSQTARDARNRWIFRYLSTELGDVLSRYADDTGLGEQSPNAPIWICWWTGENTAPPLVGQCIKSIRKHAGVHPVHLITKDNYREYLEIPAFMLKKVADGKMGFAHLADYIRVKLLATHGGLWLDATIFCSQQIPTMCFAHPLFTCKGPVRKSGYISDYRWVTFCLGGWKGNVFYRYLVDAFEQYWEQNDYAIDYLFFDHIIHLAYSQLPAISHLLDALPDNNIHRDDLQTAMNAKLPASAFDTVLQQDTAMYKLSWRETYSQSTDNNEPSIYRHFLELAL